MSDYQNRKDIDRLYDDLYDYQNRTKAVVFSKDSPYRSISSKIVDGKENSGTIDAILEYYGLTEERKNITVDDALDDESKNPVQNKVVKSAIDEKADSSHTHGNIENDGTITTSNSGYHTTYLTVNSSTDKIVKGSHLRTSVLYNSNALSNIGTSSNATQSDINSAINTKLGQMATLDQVYPVGSIYMSVNNTDPHTLFGGTWEQIGQGRTLIGQGTGTDSNNTAKTFNNGETSGEYTHTLSVDEMPSHNHTQNQHRHQLLSQQFSTGTGSASAVTNSTNRTATYRYTDYQAPTINNTGGNQAHNNLPPYLVVYMWKRTA